MLPTESAEFLKEKDRPFLKARFVTLDADGVGGVRVKPFVHLHLHSQYSLLDGAIKIDPLFERAKALGHARGAR